LLLLLVVVSDIRRNLHLKGMGVHPTFAGLRPCSTGGGGGGGSIGVLKAKRGVEWVERFRERRRL
jgi:hypothetical protein